MASPGKEPEIRKTKGSGVLGWSFNRFSVVFFKYETSVSFSGLDNMRVATPEKSTEEQNLFSAHKEEKGFALWRLDINIPA